VTRHGGSLNPRDLKALQRHDTALKGYNERGEALMASCTLMESTVVQFFKELDHEYHCDIVEPILDNLQANVDSLNTMSDKVKLTDPIMQVLVLFNKLRAINKTGITGDMGHNIYKHGSEYFYCYNKKFYPVSEIDELKTQFDNVTANVKAEYDKFSKFQLNCFHLALLFNDIDKLRNDTREDYIDAFVDLFSNSLRINLALKVKYPTNESERNIVFSVRDTLCRSYAIMESMKDQITMLANTLEDEIETATSRLPDGKVTRSKPLPHPSGMVSTYSKPPAFHGRGSRPQVSTWPMRRGEFPRHEEPPQEEDDGLPPYDE